MQPYTFKTLLYFLALTLIFCGCQTDNENTAGSAGKIIIGMTPAENAERTFDKMQAVTDYFSRKLGMEVEHLQVSNSAAMIEAMRADKIDVGSGGTFTYLVAAEKAGAEAIVTAAAPDGSPNYYRSCLITNPGSGIRTLEDIKAKSKELTLSWAYPTSTSGHLVPRYFLQENGIVPEDFKEVFIATDHASSLFTVISRKVDVAAVSYTILTRYLQMERFKEEDIHIIWRSEPITPSPVFVRGNLAPDIKKKLQQAYVDMPKDDPETWKILRGQYSFDVIYIPVNDSLYQPFRDMANKIDGLGLQ